MDQTNCQTVIEQRLSASGQTDPADVWSHVDWVHGELLITCKASIGTTVGWTCRVHQSECKQKSVWLQHKLQYLVCQRDNVCQPFKEQRNLHRSIRCHVIINMLCNMRR